jgi:hypothetical protein
MSRKVLTAIVAVGLWAGSAHAAFGPNFKVFPNPVRVDQGQSSVLFDDIQGGGELKIFNAAGRLILEKTIDGSVTSFPWDLRNGDGKDVASGIYIYFLETGGSSRTGKIGIIR